MPIRTPTCFLLLFLLTTGRADAQNQSAKPPNLDRREALKLYGLGLLCERDHRLLEAVKLFEAAVQLDPDAAPLYRALVPLYVALERHPDALAACRKALDRDPHDFETWFVCSRLYKERGQLKECRDALAKALACPKLKEQPELIIQVAADLGLMCEEAKDLDGALNAYGIVTRTLEHPEPLLEMGGPFTPADLNARAAEIYERMGTLCLQAGRLDQAVQAFARAQAKIEPAVLKKRLYLHLAKVRLAQGKPDQALADLDRYLETQPPGTDAYELKIAVLERLGRQAEIVGQMEQYANRERHNLALQLLLAARYAKDRRWRDAEARYNAVAAESPSPEVYRGLFTLYKLEDEQRQGGPPVAMRKGLHLLDDALLAAAAKEDAPPDAAAAARARSMLTVLRTDAALVKALLPLAVQEMRGFAGRQAPAGGLRSRDTAYFLAVLAARYHELDDAERLFRHCLLAPNPQTEGEVYVGLIEVLREKRNHKEIIAVCRDGLKKAKATNLVLFHTNLSLALASLGKYSDALAEADRAVEHAGDANRLRLRLRRVSLLALAEKYDKAEAECLALLKETTQPGDVRDIRHQLSGVYSAAKQHDRSEEQLRLILEADPNDDSANNDLGYVLADRGRNLEEAERLIRKAIQLEREQRKTRKVGPDDDRDHAAYIDSLGWVLFRRGRVDEARQELERATALPDGDDPVIWDHLGDVYLKLGQPDRAAAAWHKAAQLYDGDRRRKQDDQYKDLKRKLKLLKANAHR